MKKLTLFRKAVLAAFLVTMLLQAVAQPNNCILKDPLVFIHFGRGNVQDVNATPLPNFERVSGTCPTDGHYAIAASSPGCFRGDWFVLNEDHTPGDENGNMMVVNAYPGGGVFLKRLITGFKGKSTYEWALWLMNICRSDRCCSSLSPNIYVLLTTRSGKKIAGFSIGDLTQTMEPRWRKYRGFFNMPAGEKEIVLMMQDNAMGGCGNDFALDDISIRECVPQQPVVTTKSKNAAPGSVKQKLPATKQATPKDPGKTSTVKKKEHVISTSKKDSSSVITFLPIQKPATHLPTPPILRTRENPIVKQLEIPGGEIRIDLYDNGEIDGDTVSVYHNNELLISKARLSQKPVTLRMSIDNEHPHHELVMVANNLGSIPPNTSLMIITTRDKRYQVFISSSEQKNAKVVLDLKK